MKKLIVGKWYKYKEGSSEILHCGSNYYLYALCVDNAPDALVSVCGTMIWQGTLHKEDLIIAEGLEEVSTEQAIKRYVRELKKQRGAEEKPYEVEVGRNVTTALTLKIFAENEEQAELLAREEASSQDFDSGCEQDDVTYEIMHCSEM